MGTPNTRRGKTEEQKHQYRLATAASQPHRAGATDVLDHRLESPLGRLNLAGKISVEEYEAGQRYRELAFMYLHAIGSPYPFPQCCDADFTISGLMQMPLDQHCEMIEREHNRAYAAILGPEGRRGVATSVRNVVLYEEAPRSEFELDLLKVGLASLAAHFRKVVNIRPLVLA